jgi:hypothetical protein
MSWLLSPSATRQAPNAARLIITLLHQATSAYATLRLPRASALRSISTLLLLQLMEVVHCPVYLGSAQHDRTSRHASHSIFHAC